MTTDGERGTVWLWRSSQTMPSVPSVPSSPRKIGEGRLLGEGRLALEIRDSVVRRAWSANATLGHVYPGVLKTGTSILGIPWSSDAAAEAAASEVPSTAFPRARRHPTNEALQYQSRGRLVTHHSLPTSYPPPSCCTPRPSPLETRGGRSKFEIWSSGGRGGPSHSSEMPPRVEE